MLAISAKGLVKWGFYWAKRMNLRWVDFGDQRDAAILRFHSISDAAGGNYLYLEPGISLPPRTFERQIALLAQRYHCLSMDDLVEALEARKRPPRNSVVVTFDDGYRDNYEFAYPILRRHRVPAIFYLTTGCLNGGNPLWTSEVRYLFYRAEGMKFRVESLGLEYDVSARDKKERAIRDLKARLIKLPRRERDAVCGDLRARSKADLAFLRGKMLSWKQVEEMRRGGMHFGAHTVSHPLLPSVPLEEAREEIVKSRDELQARLKQPIYHFSYPNPGGGVHCDAAVKRLVQKSGYLTAVTSQQGYVNSGDDQFELPRVAVERKPWGMPWDLEREALGRALSMARFTSAKPLEKSGGA
jgi:peptidoglycan/xylan/chitin deacetylase (PgdA/CDA1 family)